MTYRLVYLGRNSILSEFEQYDPLKDSWDIVKCRVVKSKLFSSFISRL